jgi:hypothetical protein
MPHLHRCGKKEKMGNQGNLRHRSFQITRLQIIVNMENTRSSRTITKSQRCKSPRLHGWHKRYIPTILKEVGCDTPNSLLVLLLPYCPFVTTPGCAISSERDDRKDCCGKSGKNADVERVGAKESVRG